jgi:predicted dehydrogenase
MTIRIAPIRMALVGFGKIARDQHVPAIAADPAFELVAVTRRSSDPGIGVPAFTDLAALLHAMPDGLDAVAICTPPDVRHALALRALDAGLAVLLEKPPAATLGEIDALRHHARSRTCTLYAGWHSQHAPAVQPAAQLLSGATVRRLRINWHEDVRKWHPGQDWVWEPAGFGVFDPGINALSIATAILPEPLLVTSAQLNIPADRQAPIRAELAFGPNRAATFDWDHGGDEEWTITVETDDGRTIELRDGGARLLVDGVGQPLADIGEYPSIYARFARLFADGASEVDSEPLRIVADAMLVARRSTVAPFAWNAPC